MDVQRLFLNILAVVDNVARTSMAGYSFLGQQGKQKE